MKRYPTEQTQVIWLRPRKYFLKPCYWEYAAPLAACPSLGNANWGWLAAWAGEQIPYQGGSWTFKISNSVFNFPMAFWALRTQRGYEWWLFCPSNFLSTDLHQWSTWHQARFHRWSLLAVSLLVPVSSVPILLLSKIPKQRIKDVTTCESRSGQDTLMAMVGWWDVYTITSSSGIVLELDSDVFPSPKPGSAMPLSMKTSLRVFLVERTFQQVLTSLV